MLRSLFTAPPPAGRLAPHVAPRPRGSVAGRKQLSALRAVQFYLGTTRLQLEHKGDANGYTYTGIANVVPAFGFLGIPVISWLLDKQARTPARWRRGGRGHRAGPPPTAAHCPPGGLRCMRQRGAHPRLGRSASLELQAAALLPLSITSREGQLGAVDCAAACPPGRAGQGISDTPGARVAHEPPPTFCRIPGSCAIAPLCERRADGQDKQ